MNIKGLQAVAHIMSSGTLSSAAKIMHSSEPALSRQLSLLESELGLTLFHRDKRRLIPTPEGEAFYTEISRILDSIEQIPRIVKEIKAGPRRRMPIIAMPRIAAAVAAPAVSRLSEEYPDIQISLDIQPMRHLERWIASHQFELGIGALPTQHESIETEFLCQSPAVAVVSPNHRLSEYTSVTVNELAKEKLITLFPNTVLHQAVEEIFDRANTPLTVSLQTSLTSMCCVLASQDAGVTICDAMAPAVLGQSVRMIPIEPRYEFDFGLLYPIGSKRTSEAVRLAEIVREEAKNYLNGLPFK